MTWPNEKSARCFDLRLSGYTYAEIAAEMGITRNAVAGYLDRHGVVDAAERERIRRWQPERDHINEGCLTYQVPAYRQNDDHKHLTLLLAALREQAAA